MKSTIFRLLVLLLFAVPAAVQAQFNYSTNADNTLTVTSYTGPGGAVIIPDAINGLTVTTIGSGCGQGLGAGCDVVFGKNVTSITIPTSVTSIGATAFQGCSNITSITIPISVISIGSQAFEKCYDLFTVYFEGNAPTVGSSVFSGDNNATIYYLAGANGWSTNFAGLTAEVLPYSYTTNADNSVTITGCTGLGGLVNIPANFFGLPVTSIEAGAFSGANLTSITIPSSITNIGDDAFQGCTSLNTVYFQGNAPAADTTVFSGDNNAAIYYLFGASGWSFPFAGLPAVSATAPSQFTYVTNAGDITISGYIGPGGAVIIPFVINGLPVTTIGTGCGGGLGASGDYVFNSNNVTSITIPASVTNFGGCAFENSYSLVSIFFQGNPPTIGDFVFGGNTNATIYYLSEAAGWSSEVDPIL